MVEVGRQVGRAFQPRLARSEAGGDLVGRQVRGPVEPHLGRGAQRLWLGAQVRKEQQRRALGHARAAGDLVRAVPAFWLPPLLRELGAAPVRAEAASKESQVWEKSRCLIRNISAAVIISPSKEKLFIMELVVGLSKC